MLSSNYKYIVNVSSQAVNMYMYMYVQIILFRKLVRLKYIRVDLATGSAR